MKQKLIAVTLALASSPVLAQTAPAASNGQSNIQAANGQSQTQTTVPSDNSRTSLSSAEVQKGQPVEGAKVDAWSLLSRGWKQFDNEGKQ
jgi:uncharacterized protein YdeI (BOF family)